MQREEEERAKKEAEEQERARKEAEERAAAAAAAEVEPSASLEATPEAATPTESEHVTEEAEDGEVDESRDKVQEKPPLRLDTTLDKKRPGPLDLSGTKGPIPQPLPSALATARNIEDISTIEYPEGIQSPRVELNVNAKQGKFRYVKSCSELQIYADRLFN